MRRRHGFTITELLVSMALVMFIMAILSTAFVAGLTAFRDLKATGDMDQKMRALLVVLARDLSDDHFNKSVAGQTGVQTGSEPAAITDLTMVGSGNIPTQGFFVIYQGSASTSELGGAVDQDSIPSYVATNHALYFTVNRGTTTNNHASTKYGRIENYLVANVVSNPPNSASLPTLATRSPFVDGQNYLSLFGEVAYFMQASGATTTGASPQALYTLYRRQAVILTDADVAAMVAASQTGAGLVDVSSNPNTIGITANQFNKMSDVAAQTATPAQTPVNRRFLGQGANPPTLTPYPQTIGGNPNTLYGSDVLLTNVLSFCVRVFKSPSTTNDFEDLGTTFPATYDSGNPPAYSINAIQVIIRVWDDKTQQARQVTLTQYMGNPSW